MEEEYFEAFGGAGYVPGEVTTRHLAGILTILVALQIVHGVRFATFLDLVHPAFGRAKGRDSYVNIAFRVVSFASAVLAARCATALAFSAIEA